MQQPSMLLTRAVGLLCGSFACPQYFGGSAPRAAHSVSAGYRAAGGFSAGEHQVTNAACSHMCARGGGAAHHTVSHRAHSCRSVSPATLLSCLPSYLGQVHVHFPVQAYPFAVVAPAGTAVSSSASASAGGGSGVSMSAGPLMMMASHSAMGAAVHHLASPVRFMSMLEHKVVDPLIAEAVRSAEAGCK